MSGYKYKIKRENQQKKRKKKQERIEIRLKLLKKSDNIFNIHIFIFRDDNVLNNML